MAIRIVDYKRLQHYKHRNPPWVKLHVADLLDPDNIAFWRLSDASKLLAVCLQALASRHENAIPEDLPWLLERLPIKNKKSIEGGLQELLSAGVIEMEGHASGALAPCKQNALSEKSREEKRGEEGNGSAPGGAIGLFSKLWAIRYGETPHPSKEDCMAVNTALKPYGKEEREQIVESYLSDDDKWIVENGHRLGLLPKRIPALRAKRLAKPAGPSFEDRKAAAAAERAARQGEESEEA